MPIVLDQAISLQSIDSEPVECTHLKIVSVRLLLEAKQLDIDIKLGTHVGGKFKAAPGKVKRYSVCNQKEIIKEIVLDEEKGPEKVVVQKENLAYSKLISSKVKQDEILYDGGGKQLYKWLMKKNQRFSGTII